MIAEIVTVCVTRLLDQLGNTPDAVADRLRALNVKGARIACGPCPIEIYLLCSDLNPAQVVVGDTYATLDFGDPVDQRVNVRLPAAVTAFIHRFDDGVYLDLVGIPAVTR
jgi:hypothetical protein